jgi:hypothetical protein
VALLEGLKSGGKRTTACLVSSVACPKKLKASPDGKEAAVDTFERSKDKMEATNLEASPEAMEAADLRFHGGDYEEWRLLGCYAVWLL